MTPIKIAIVSPVLSLILVMTLVGGVIQYSSSISSSGAIRYPTLGSIIYQDSFENYTVDGTKFTHWSQEGCPADWFPDIGESPADLESYGEVVDTTAGDGAKSVKLYAIKSPDKTTVWANLFRWTGSWADGYTEFYVRWYQMFENLPLNNWKYFKIIFLTAGNVSAYYAPTAWTEVIKSDDVYNIRMRRLWGASEQTVPYPFATNIWYTFELYYKYGTTDGEYRLLIDDQEIIALTGLNTTPIDKYGIAHDPSEDPSWLPKGIDVGIESRDDTTSYTVYVDGFLFADYFYGRAQPPSSEYIFSTGFEVEDSLDDNHPYSSYQVGQQVDYGEYADGHRIVQSDVVHSGTQAFKCWGLKETLWNEETIPVGTPSTGEFIGGPYDGTPQEGTLTIGDLMNDPAYGNMLDQNYIDTYHFANEWLQWDDGTQKYYATVGTADPRSRLRKTIDPLSDLYLRVFVRVDELGSWLQILRNWNFEGEGGEGDYVSQVFIRNSSIQVKLGATKKHPWNAYELVDGERTPIGTITADYAVTLGEWYYIEHRFKMSESGQYDGGVQVWICQAGSSPTLIIDRMDLDTSESGPVASVFTGIITCNGETLIYVDDWAIGTEYIGAP